MSQSDEAENGLRRYVMRFGPYRGRSLEQIAAAPGGMKYLASVPTWRPRYFTAEVREGQSRVGEFLALPSIAAAVAKAKSAPRCHTRTARTHAEAERQKEYGL